MRSRPPHKSASAGHTPQGDIAHTAAFIRTAPYCLATLTPSIVSKDSSSLPAVPTHNSIASSSGASSSMQADTREVVKVAMFEAPVTHPVDETRSFFAMEYGGCVWVTYATSVPAFDMCYCIMVAGATCTALTSKFASERMMMDKA